MTNLTDFGGNFDSNFNEKLKQDPNYQSALGLVNESYILDIEKCMSHNFRYYQKEAIAAFEYMMGLPETDWFKNSIFEEIEDNRFPFYGFEMATGSGKTLLMGALMLHLYNKYKVNNFLIIVPSTAIFEKTINNFNSDHIKRVFSNYLTSKYNLVTGDNFTDWSSNFDPDANFNIYIFTIQKFFERMKDDKSTLKVDKIWEGSPWKRGSNTISFREFLRGQNLAIFTDEAHHYQHYRIGRNSNKSSGDIIADFHPNLVLEFTATAVTEDPSICRRNQKIIYEYPINRLLTDGYGKKIRAFGYTGSQILTDDSEISLEDKKKFLVAYLIHNVKLKALADDLLEPGDNRIKPILLVRARDITHAENLLLSIEEDIIHDDNLIEEVFSEIVDGQKYDITKMVKGFVTIDEFKRKLKELPGKTFTFHSDNDTNPDVRKKIEKIESNDQEVLIQIKKLEEGWDLLNPYTILILSNNTGDSVKRYVRQLIGRGVRLFREKRIMGDLTGLLEEHQEVLHVVCNRGTSFHNFIETIRNDMGLSNKNFEIESTKVNVKNTIRPEFGKYIGLNLPYVQIGHTFNNSPEHLFSKLNYDDLEISQWLDDHSYTNSDRNLIWNISEEDSFTEIGISDECDYHRGTQEPIIKPLNLNQQEVKSIVRYVIDNQSVLPSVVATRKKLSEAIIKLNDQNIMYLDYGPKSREFVIQHFCYFLKIHIVRVIDGVFTEVRNESELDIYRYFPEYTINVEQDSDSDNLIGIVNWREFVAPEKVTSSHLNKIFITGWQKSWFRFNKFDTGPEYRLAIKLDQCHDVEFWIRNERQFFLRYGTHKYHPDFIVYSEGKLYLVEPKGKNLLNDLRTKNEISLLKDYQNMGLGAILLVDQTINNIIYGHTHSFEDIIENNDLNRL